MTSGKLTQLIFLPLLLGACTQPSNSSPAPVTDDQAPQVVILGTVQDAGSPQAGCERNCCKKLYQNPEPTRMVSSLALLDPVNQSRYLFEAGPDFSRQLHLLNHLSSVSSPTPWPDAIFISHAHIGHYSGLLKLGKESMNAQSARVYVMPRMKSFLEKNGPWEQLCSNQNIELLRLKSDSAIHLPGNISVTPLLVPHRDEYSETVGFLITGSNKSLLFVPDIDKWEKWDRDLIQLMKRVDYALLDGTFFGEGEVPGRNMKEIPHPFVQESMDLLMALEGREKEKVHFIHLNHSNPLLDSSSAEYQEVHARGFKVARFGQTFRL